MFGIGIHEIIILLVILGMMAAPVMIVIAIIFYVWRSQSKVAASNTDLSRCRDCGGTVLQRAMNCPHCGHPMAARDVRL